MLTISCCTFLKCCPKNQYYYYWTLYTVDCTVQIGVAASGTRLKIVWICKNECWKSVCVPGSCMQCILGTGLLSWDQFDSRHMYCQIENKNHKKVPRSKVEQMITTTFFNVLKIYKRTRNVINIKFLTVKVIMWTTNNVLSVKYNK